MSEEKPQKAPLTSDEIDRVHKAAESGNIAEMEALRKEIDAAFTGMLSSELGELERISSFTEKVKEKLTKHYSKIFPKKCNSCGTIYATREDFIAATHSLSTEDTIFDEIGLQEYRNCPCGSTLIVWTRDRRDNSDYGKLRRQLFDDCLQKIKKISHEPEEQIITRLRKVFSALS